MSKKVIVKLNTCPNCGSNKIKWQSNFPDGMGDCIVDGFCNMVGFKQEAMCLVCGIKWVEYSKLVLSKIVLNNKMYRGTKRIGDPR